MDEEKEQGAIEQLLNIEETPKEGKPGQSLSEWFAQKRLTRKKEATRSPVRQLPYR